MAAGEPPDAEPDAFNDAVGANGFGHVRGAGSDETGTRR